NPLSVHPTDRLSEPLRRVPSCLRPSAVRAKPHIHHSGLAPFITNFRRPRAGKLRGFGPFELGGNLNLPLKNLGSPRKQLIPVQPTNPKCDGQLLFACGELRVGCDETNPLLFLPEPQSGTFAEVLDELAKPLGTQEGAECLSQTCSIRHRCFSR